MTDIDTPQREQVDARCCCVLIDQDTQEESVCNGLTTGPDDPFCEACTSRHPFFYDIVTQRLRERT